MRLLIVGPDKIFSIENFYVRYLKDLGVVVEQFSSQNIFEDYYHGSLLNKLIFRSGLSGIYSHINELFVEQVKRTKPDLIWIFKGMEILPASLKWARSLGIRLANYNPDNPFLFSGRGSGNQNVTDSIGLFDLHFTYNLEIQKRLESEFKVKTAFLPFGFDIAYSTYEMCSHVDEIQGACFLGNPDNQRAEFIQALADKGIAVSVYGHGWKKFIKHSTVQCFDAVYGIDQLKVLRKYRVQLNLMRIHNENSHNMRTFEVPGIGGIMVAPDTPEHRLFFEHGKEVFLYKDITECAAIIKGLLDLPVGEASVIREAARNRSINSGYSYKHRSEQVLNELECLPRKK